MEEVWFEGDEWNPNPIQVGYVMVCPKCGLAAKMEIQQRRWSGKLDTLRGKAFAAWEGKMLEPEMDPNSSDCSYY